MLGRQFPAAGIVRRSSLICVLFLFLTGYLLYMVGMSVKLQALRRRWQRVNRDSYLNLIYYATAGALK